ncbi:hypothetical protein ABFY60_11150 [Lysinibacillus pakistanensis]|uniref:hypothetical protein n=1 Tax=Lysinibacillus pakistanensis TaxID=759811 RepID=UPI003D2CCEB3
MDEKELVETNENVENVTENTEDSDNLSSDASVDVDETENSDNVEETEYEKQMREVTELRQQLEAQLFESQLKERGLEIFLEIGKVNELEGTEKLDYLQGLVDAILAKHSYKPLNPVGDSPNDVIETELKQGKVENSLGHKFKGWFGSSK